MAAPGIGSGTAAGLMEFLDFMISKGYGTSGSISPWKSAAKNVFQGVEGEDFGDTEVRNLDVEEYFERFANRSMGKYSSDSLAAYRSRFRKAVDSYRSYLADPNWKPSQRAATRKQASDSSPSSRKKPVAQAPSAPDPAAVTGPTAPAMITYPFPLKSGQMAQLQLPTQLEKDDVERMTSFLRALVFEQPRQLLSGDPDEQ